MKPQEAGFDGAKGINMNHPAMPDGGLFQLRRGKKSLQPEKYNLKNQLLWYYPDDEDAKLYYCNQNNQLFELDFIPVNQ
jgi:hypothetical protein